MRHILALAVTTVLAASVPALAQNAGSPGAVGTAGGMSGSNPGSSAYRGYNNYPDDYGNGAAPYGYDRPVPYGYMDGPRVDEPGVYAPGPYPYGYKYDPALREGRASAPEDVQPNDLNPETVNR